MRASPSLIREIDRLAHDHGWTGAQLAAELGVNDTELMHVRAARRHCSLTLLVRIAVRFGDRPTIPSLLFQYLAVDLPLWMGTHKAVPTRTRPALPPKAQTVIETYLAAFPHENMFGRGLWLTSASPVLLGIAASYVATTIQTPGLGVLRLAGSATPTAREVQSALAATVLIVESVETATAAMIDLLRQRSELVRPLLVTSRVDPSALGREVHRVLRTARLTHVTIPDATSPPAAA